MIWYCQKCKKLYREDPGRRCDICKGKIFRADSEKAFLAEGYGYDEPKDQKRGMSEVAKAVEESYMADIKGLVNNSRGKIQRILADGDAKEQKAPSGKKEGEEAALLRKEEERVAQIKRQKEIEREQRQQKLEEQRKKARAGSTPEPSRTEAVTGTIRGTGLTGMADPSKTETMTGTGKGTTTADLSRPISVRREKVSSLETSTTDSGASAKTAADMLAGLGLQRKKS